jgi:hypothetical protein
MPEYVLYPEEIIALNEELATGYHPKLEEQLAGQDDFIERFATIATYCDVALDGMYSSDQMVAMVGAVFLDRLVRRRENPNRMIIVE